MSVIGVILSILAAGLALLLARETRLRRALQALCNRLLGRLADAEAKSFPISPSKFRTRSRRR
jgi:hypothetical protein